MGPAVMFYKWKTFKAAIQRISWRRVYGFCYFMEENTESRKLIA